MDKNENNSDPFEQPVKKRGALAPLFFCILALFVAGQVLLNAALFVRDTHIRSDIISVFWVFEDARAAAGAAYESSYYTSPHNREQAVRDVRVEMARLNNANDRLISVQQRNSLFARIDRSILLRFVSNVFLLDRFRRLEQFNDEQIVSLHAMRRDIFSIMQLYAVTLGPRDTSSLHQIKSREAEVLKEYLRNRNTVARSLEIPSEEKLIKELELKMDKRYMP
jgi:hypothetical protein